MKRLLACLILLSATTALAAPDPRDSVIIESKTVSPVYGACASASVRVKVWITNKDTLANITIPFLTRSLNGNAYATLSRNSSCSSTRSFINVFDWLIPGTALGSRILNANNYHSDSPDTFLLAATQSSPDPENNLTPNSTRLLLVEIRFDTIKAALGSFTIDTGRVNANFIQFVTPQGQPVEVNFVPGVISVFAGGCGQFSNCPPSFSNVLFGRSFSYNFNASCEGQPGVRWFVQVGPGTIDSLTGVYSFSGQCPLGFVPVTVRLSNPFGTFSDCQFVIAVVDNPPSSNPAQGTVTVSHGQFASNQIVASDPDNGDGASYAKISGPGFVDSTGLWFLSTGCGDVAASPQTVRVRVNDYFQNCKPGPLADTAEFVLIVTNASPSMTNCPSATVALDTNAFYSHQLSATDPDPADASLNFFLVSAPVGVSISSSGLVQWTPSSSQAGAFLTTFRVMDGCGAFADCQIRFKVSLRKGDLDGDGQLTGADVVQMLNYAYFGIIPKAGPEACDLNCDGIANSVDVILELNAAFLGDPFPC